MKHGGDIYRNKVDIDFSVNLNPLKMPQSVRSAIIGSAEISGVYPDPDQEEVRSVIAKAEGVSPECIRAGCGASQLIMAAVLAQKPGKALLFEPCFSGYRHALDAVGCKILEHELNEERGFALTGQDIRAISPDVDIVFVCDPLSPSGSNVDEDVIDSIIDISKRYGITVVLDESFYLMSDKGCKDQRDRNMRLLESCKDLYIIHSLTKILSAPGVRAGYVLSSADNIKRLADHLPEWNLPAACSEVIKAGMHEIYETDLVHECACVVRKEREYLSDSLIRLGFDVIKSNTSYILFRGRKDLYEKLLAERILIRDCSDYRGLSKGWYRVGVRSHDDNERLIDAIRGLGRNCHEA